VTLNAQDHRDNAKARNTFNEAVKTKAKHEEIMSEHDYKQMVMELLASLETGDSKPLSTINPSRYIQHNLGAGDGVQGFAELMRRLPPGSARARPVRVFQDGDFVFAHTEYDFFGPKIGFDIFRFEAGQIVEHWDNLQAAEPANISGHTMTDGPTESQDRDQTERNKTLVRRFMEEVIVKGQTEQRAGYYDGDHYLQHSPLFGDGVSGLWRGLDTLAAQGITASFDRVHRVLGEGNFVLVVSEGVLSGQPAAFYDLFRVENSKIAEHWDTVETIPPPAAWKNSNGKF
jgi:predicted SnoaL-like aldol condensation-catalyzing enzyme